MDELGCSVYYLEIHRQCKNAKIAYENILRTLDEMGKMHDINEMEKQMDLFWYSINSLLVAAGNVSKLLWGINKSKNKKLKIRTRTLRSQLLISDSFNLKDRRMRDHFEHFDERLDDWIMKNKRKTFVDSNIMPLGAVSVHEGVRFLRNFDQTTFTLSCLDDKFDINQIAIEIQEIFKKVNDKLGMEF